MVRLKTSFLQSKRKFISLFLFVVLFLFAGLMFGDRSGFAETGGGAEGGGTIVRCDNFLYAFQGVCKKSNGYDDNGGASWHIYNINSGPARPPANSEFLDNTFDYDRELSAAQNGCREDGYYVAYGWDGRRYGLGTEGVHWGFAGWKFGSLAGAEYNTIGAITKQQIIDARGNLSGWNGQRITEDAARYLYNKATGESDIKVKDGWFCTDGGGPFDDVWGRVEVQRVGGTQSANTGFTQKTMEQAVLSMNNCPAGGCDAKFTMSLRWTRGQTSANYKYRTLENGNWSTWSSGTATANSGSNGVKIYETTKNAGLGKTVCVQLEFLKVANSGDPVYLMACAKANGEIAQNIGLSHQVKNESVKKYNTFQQEVYAKPGDKVVFQSKYNPATQFAYGLNPGLSTVFVCDDITRTYTTNSLTVGALMMSACQRVWNSAFSVQRKTYGAGDWNGEVRNYYGSPSWVGSTNERVVSKDLTISGSQVGSSGSVSERAIANLNNDTKWTPTTAKVIYNSSEFIEKAVYLSSMQEPSKVIDVSGASGDKVAANSTKVITYAKHGGNNQQWLMQRVPGTSDIYNLVSVNSGKVLDIPGGCNEAKNGLQLIVFQQHGGKNQQWKRIDRGNNVYTFKTACDGKNFVLDKDLADGANGKLIIYEDHGGNNQRWKAESVTNAKGAYTRVEITTGNTTSGVASALVPYNFINIAELDALNNTGILYAGENINVNYRIAVKDKRNNLTDGTYATVVKNAQWKLQMKNDSNWIDLENNTGNLNESGVGNGRVIGKSSTVPVPDVKAGTKVCLRAAVYPANSGADNNLDSKGSNTWAYSAERCYTIAKRPSIQVWGGNVYSTGGIKTSTSVKRRLAGYNNSNYVFGSFAELGILSIGQISGFASGASYGYTSNNNGNLIASPGGSRDVDFRRNSVLTFGGTTSNGFGSNATIENMRQINNEIIERLKNGEVSNVNYINIENQNYYIDADIMNNDMYQSYDNIKRTVIYARNIYIACNVTRIDALLIAKNEVITCANSDGVQPSVNDRIRSNQLQVNGAIVANKLIANRTYGSATGNNSIVPAEIINFDSTFYYWGNSNHAVDGDSGNDGDGTSDGWFVNQSYLREVSPRY